MIRSTKAEEIKRVWHLFDAKGQVLGRFATQLVPLLIGKNKPYFVRNLDCGDYLVVINAKEIAVTGRKEEQKMYLHYSGYPSGLKKRTLSQLREAHPEEIIRLAVRKMLPQNKLRDRWLAKLFIFAEEKHDYEDKFKTKEKKA